MNILKLRFHSFSLQILRTRVLVGLCGLFVSTSLVQADVLSWDWSYHSLGNVIVYSGSGTLTTTSSGSDYQVTSITGTWNGDNITGLSNLGASDNLLTALAPQPQLDDDGLSFTTSTTGSFNIYHIGEVYMAWNGAPPSVDGGGTFTATIVPEPATNAFLALLIAMVALGARQGYFRRVYLKR